MVSPMAHRRDKLEARQKFCFRLDQVEPLMDQRQGLTAKGSHILRHRRQIALCRPKLPGSPPHHIASLGKSEVSLIIQNSANMVPISMGENDGINSLGRNSFSLQIPDKFAWPRS